MAEISLTKGYVAIVDDEDFELVSAHKWYAEVCGLQVYACRRDHSLSNKPKVYLHRMLTGAIKGQIVDHRDLNSLNCQRSNLRITNKRGNSSNRGKMRKITSSSFKGVTLDKRSGRWVAQIETRGVRKYLGSYADEISAARTYDAAANDAFGAFARLNFEKQAA